VDSHNVIPANTVIGYNSDTDAEKFHIDRDSGLVVVPMPKIQLRKNLQILDNSRFDDEMTFSSF
jgi:glucose-1-phosphate adenylyltransferase